MDGPESIRVTGTLDEVEMLKGVSLLEDIDAKLLHHLFGGPGNLTTEGVVGLVGEGFGIVLSVQVVCSNMQSICVLTNPAKGDGCGDVGLPQAVGDDPWGGVHADVKDGTGLPRATVWGVLAFPISRHAEVYDLLGLKTATDFKR